MFKRNGVLLGASLLISIIYFIIYALTNGLLGNGVSSKLTSLGISILTFVVYFKLGSFISRLDIRKFSKVNNVLSISSLVVVSFFIWIYSFTQNLFNPGVAGLEWIPYFFINAPYLAVNDLINCYLPYLYFIYPYITTFIVFMGIKYGKLKLLKDEN
ncbi:MAG: hypothetical protein Q8942_19890 [Bacillota bacterium]|nr:hypothetical protein [Bacillota bacterium]